nr:hypothetical protein [Micromonospora sp. DSM 115978]
MTLQTNASPTVTGAAATAGKAAPAKSGATSRAGRGGGVRSHPWAGVSSSRRVEVEAARERLSAGRAGASGRAEAALAAFFASGGDVSAVAALESDSEALFEVQGLAERWARGMAGVALRAAGLFVRARAVSEVADVKRSGVAPPGRARVDQMVDEQRPVEGYLG